MQSLQKGRKGFIIQVGKYILPGVTSFAEAVYLVRRRYNRSPHVGDVIISINNKILYRYDRVKKEETFMISNATTFEEFEQELESKGQSIDTIPNMEQEDRTLFIKLGVPFLVTQANTVDTKYGTRIVYSVQVVVDSQEYQGSGKQLEIGSQYVLWGAATEGRLLQLKNILQPRIDNRIPLMLVKPNKGAWDFRDYKPKSN